MSVAPESVGLSSERPMEFRDLLTHTSGLTYPFTERTNVDAAYRKLGIGGAGTQGTLRETIDQLASLPLEFSPGTRWSYSVATDVCGYLVEVISGKPLDAFLRERILDPLGMRDTGFHVPPSERHRLAANYTRRRDKSLRVEDDPETSSYLEPPSFLSGGGGLVSIAADHLRFCRMPHARGELDGARILGRKTLEPMVRNHLPGGADLSELARGIFAETSYDRVGFGPGFSVQLDPARSGVIGSAGEYAGGGAASTVFWVDPVEDLIVIFLTQLMPSHTFDFRGRRKALVYPSLVDAAA